MKRVAKEIDTDELCSYGCGQVARFKNASDNLMCCERSNSCPAIKRKNSDSLKQSYANGTRQPAVQRYDSLSKDVKDRMAWSRGKFTNTVFEYDGTGNHKGFLIQERGHQCECCGLAEWIGNPITIELEHIDGDNRNNTKTNLKLLCPNCHSFTDTWRGKNSVKKKERQYVSAEEFIIALSESKNIRQALLKLKLTPKGANYERANKLLYGGVVKLANTSDLSSDASA